MIHADLNPNGQYPCIPTYLFYAHDVCFKND